MKTQIDSISKNMTPLVEESAVLWSGSTAWSWTTNCVQITVLISWGVSMVHCGVCGLWMLLIGENFPPQSPPMLRHSNWLQAQLTGKILLIWVNKVKVIFVFGYVGKRIKLDVFADCHKRRKTRTCWVSGPCYRLVHSLRKETSLQGVEASPTFLEMCCDRRGCHCAHM